MLLSESPKSSAKPPTHTQPSPSRGKSNQAPPYTTKPRQKPNWKTTATESIEKEDDEADAVISPSDEGPSPPSYGRFVTPAPRVSRTIRPFTSTSYYTTTPAGVGYTDVPLAEGREAGGVTSTHPVPESVARPQLGSAARWTSTGRGLMSGLAGAPRRGTVRRESSDQEDKESFDEPSPDAVAYGRGVAPSVSPGGSPLQRAARALYDGENRRENEPRDFELPESRGPTPDILSESQRRVSRPSRRTTPELPNHTLPEPMETDSPHQSPIPKLIGVKSSYSRFSRRASSISGSGSGSTSSLRSSSAASQPQSQPQGQDKENILPFSSHRSVTFSGKLVVPPSAPVKRDLDTPRSPTPNKAPKMAPLVSTRTPTPEDHQRRDALVTRDRNTPHRPPPPPPPPKMSMVNTVTASAGAQSSRKRGQVIINGRQYRRLDAIGKGGSSRVYKVMAENFRVFAMKKVTFSDEEDGQAAVLGYKGEIELLKKLEKVDRVIRLYDYEVNDSKGYLIMVRQTTTYSFGY